MSTARHALVCACASKHIDVLAAYVAQSDELVAKALSLSEVAQIARMEVRLRDYLLAKWRIRANEAAQLAGSVVASGGRLDKALAKVDATMGLWPADVEHVFVATADKVYRLARIAGFKKATGRTKASLQYIISEDKKVQKARPASPPPGKIPDIDTSYQMSFDLQDKKAIATLAKQEMIWIGEHYGENVSSVVRAAVNEKLIAGLGREAAGRIIREMVGEKLKSVGIPSGWRGTDTDYFEGLAANVATNARVQGQLESFSRIKVVTYEIVNPMDNRTTPFCADMNGTLFTVADGMNQLSNMRAAKTPDGIRSAAPWVSAKTAAGIRAKGGSKALAAAGLALPPYHFRCRTTIDVSSESSSYADIVDG